GSLALLAAPLAAEAQQARVPRIGYLSLGAAEPPGILGERLRETGYVLGQNVTIDYRLGEGKHDAMGALARELVDLNVDVIMAVGDEAVVAAKKATTIIPIVMFSCDALAVGFVSSLARPGGDITGLAITISPEVEAKRLELLREMLPRVSRVAYL